MFYATRSTHPSPVCERERVVLLAATRTRLATGEEPIHLLKAHAPFTGYMRQDLHEAREAEVAHLAAPQPLHALKVEVFDSNGVVRVAEPMRKLEVEVTPHSSGSGLVLRLADASFAPVIRAALLAGERALQLGKAASPCLKELRRLNSPAVRGRQEVLEAEVQPNRAHYLLVRCWILRIKDDAETDEQSAYSVALDRYGFNGALNLSAQGKLIVLRADAQLIAAEVLPPRLSEREAAVLSALLEPRLTCLGIGEEALIAFVKSNHNILNSLASELLPVWVTTAQLGDVALELVHAEVLAVEAVVAPSQGHRVVPDGGSNVNLFDKVFVAFRRVEAVFKRTAHYLHNLTLGSDSFGAYLFSQSSSCANSLLRVRESPCIPALKSEGLSLSRALTFL